MKRKDIIAHVEKVGSCIAGADIDGMAKVVKPSKNELTAIKIGIELGLAFVQIMLEDDECTPQRPVADAVDLFSAAMTEYTNAIAEAADD